MVPVNSSFSNVNDDNGGGADDVEYADNGDDDDVKKKLGVVEGAFALLCPAIGQTGSGDGSKEVLLLLLLYCPVTKLFTHNAGHDFDESMMMMILVRPLEDDDDNDEGDCFSLEN